MFALKGAATTRTPLGTSPLLLVQGVVVRTVLVMVGSAHTELAVIKYHVLMALAQGEDANIPIAWLENVHMTVVTEVCANMEIVPARARTKIAEEVYVVMGGVLVDDVTIITKIMQRKVAQEGFVHMEVAVVWESVNMDRVQAESANTAHVKRKIVNTAGIRRQEIEAVSN
jgi:hypothetical protein